MQAQKTILLVDDSLMMRMAGKMALCAEYNIIEAESGDEMLRKLLAGALPDLILLDVEMPGMSGYEAIKELKRSPVTMGIPVIFLTGHSDVESELLGLSLGAIDYISKPFSPPLLRRRLETHFLIIRQRTELLVYNNNLQRLVTDKTTEIRALQAVLLDTMSELVEYRDDVTGGHIFRTQSYMRLLLDRLLADNVYIDEISGWDLSFLIPSCQLHDIGKIAIKDSVLNKPGRFTPEEFEEMKRHTTIGVQILDKVESNRVTCDFIKHAKLFAGTHHEKWDGTGYPNGMRALEIPLQGRLMAIADVYDALVSARPYKPGMSVAEAERIIRDGSGVHFDPILVHVFDEVAGKFAAIAARN